MFVRCLTKVLLCCNKCKKLKIVCNKIMIVLIVLGENWLKMSQINLVPSRSQIVMIYIYVFYVYLCN